MHVFFLLGFYVIENLCFYPASNFWVGGILPSKGRTRSSKLLWEDSLCSTWTVQFSLSFFFRYGIIEDLNRGFFVCSFFFIGLFFFFFFFFFIFLWGWVYPWLATWCNSGVPLSCGYTRTFSFNCIHGTGPNHFLIARLFIQRG